MSLSQALNQFAQNLGRYPELEAAGWRVITVWECELTKAVRDERLVRLYEQIVEGDADSAE